MRAPASWRCCGVRPLTVAWVPTGMKTGVSTTPCGVWSRPSRAAPSVCTISNWIAIPNERPLAKTQRSPRGQTRGCLLGGLCVFARGHSCLISAEGQAELSQLLADLVQRGHAEVLRFEQFIRAALHQLAERVDAQAIHALARPHREVQIADRLAEHRLFLLGHRLLGAVADFVLRPFFERLA